MRNAQSVSFVSEEFMLEDIILEPDSISATDCIPPSTVSWSQQHVVVKRSDVSLYLLGCMTCLPRPEAIFTLPPEFFSLRTSGPYSMTFVHLVSMVWYTGAVHKQAARVTLISATLVRAVQVGADLHALTNAVGRPFSPCWSKGSE